MVKTKSTTPKPERKPATRSRRDKSEMVGNIRNAITMGTSIKREEGANLNLGRAQEIAKVAASIEALTEAENKFLKAAVDALKDLPRSIEESNVQTEQVLKQIAKAIVDLEKQLEDAEKKGDKERAEALRGKIASTRALGEKESGEMIKRSLDVAPKSFGEGVGRLLGVQPKEMREAGGGVKGFFKAYTSGTGGLKDAFASNEELVKKYDINPFKDAMAKERLSTDVGKTMGKAREEEIAERMKSVPEHLRIKSDSKGRYRVSKDSGARVDEFLESGARNSRFEFGTLGGLMDEKTGKKHKYGITKGEAEEQKEKPARRRKQEGTQEPVPGKFDRSGSAIFEDETVKKDTSGKFYANVTESLEEITEKLDEMKSSLATIAENGGVGGGSSLMDLIPNRRGGRRGRRGRGRGRGRGGRGGRAPRPSTPRAARAPGRMSRMLSRLRPSPTMTSRLTQGGGRALQAGGRVLGAAGRVAGKVAAPLAAVMAGAEGLSEYKKSKESGEGTGMAVARGFVGASNTLTFGLTGWIGKKAQEREDKKRSEKENKEFEASEKKYEEAVASGKAPLSGPTIVARAKKLREDDKNKEPAAPLMRYVAKARQEVQAGNPPTPTPATPAPATPAPAPAATPAPARAQATVAKPSEADMRTALRMPPAAAARPATGASLEAAGRAPTPVTAPPAPPSVVNAPVNNIVNNSSSGANTPNVASVAVRDTHGSHRRFQDRRMNRVM